MQEQAPWAEEPKASTEPPPPPNLDIIPPPPGGWPNNPRLGVPLTKCAKPDCNRLTTAEYCCAPCSAAADMRAEIDKHSVGCDKRWTQRNLMGSSDA